MHRLDTFFVQRFVFRAGWGGSRVVDVVCPGPNLAEGNGEHSSALFGIICQPFPQGNGAGHSDCQRHFTVSAAGVRAAAFCLCLSCRTDSTRLKRVALSAAVLLPSGFCPDRFRSCYQAPFGTGAVHTNVYTMFDFISCLTLSRGLYLFTRLVSSITESTTLVHCCHSSFLTGVLEVPSKHMPNSV